ncbi:MAG: class II glutamine amidotransferase [Gammaproteobacteria bacterium]
MAPAIHKTGPHRIHSLNVIAHIRSATQGIVSLENTQLSQRELWGKYWVYAHNGNLPQFQPELDGSFLPVGNTDSEHIFCWLLQSLRRRFGYTPPTRDELFTALHELIYRLSGMGIFNFLLCNGDCLFAHCSTELSHIVRRAPFRTAHLKDDDVMVDFSEVTTPNDRVVVVATQPLTDNEDWVTMEPGSLWLFHDGDVVCHRTHSGRKSPLSERLY